MFVIVCRRDIEIRAAIMQSDFIRRKNSHPGQKINKNDKKKRTVIAYRCNTDSSKAFRSQGLSGACLPKCNISLELIKGCVRPRRLATRRVILILQS